MAGIEIRDPGPDPLVKSGQGVKGHGGKRMVLGVVRHVPREQASQW